MVLAYSCADALHPVEEFCEFVDRGLMRGGIDTGLPQGPQALDEAPDFPIIDAATFERRIEYCETRGRVAPGHSILGGNFRQVEF
jgi:hypothetical protein